MTIRDFLSRREIAYTPLLHRPSQSATRRAHSVHASGSAVAKAVLLRADGEFLLAVLPSTHRIDLEVLSSLVDAFEVQIASEDELDVAFPDCEHGAIPPFGSLYGMKSIVEADLAAGGEIFVEGNLRHEDLRLSFRDYASLESPRIGHFSRPIASKKARESRRQAG